ncbi:tumor necrosis factor receptor superfamily member 18 [Vidua chalybeata]|uniref:tumor necrosis factor receptor superfamily member 18 n=1 Tax=Vidua chalybeata TaxID=81927 RepID=UPI0023A851FF|nr:tumor necrosis factor receptor superfamily member 18 [Vidua chalybeata]
MAGCRLWLLLALLAGRWARPGRAGHCQAGELRPVWGDGTKCCPRCTWRGRTPAPCEAAQDHDCKCPPGHGCADEPCQFCRALPRCPPGWEPSRIGRVNFQFECKPCENGTYSSSRRSWCRNWTDCESSGFVTLREGSSTHNAVCGLPGAGPQPARPPPELRSSPALAALAAAAAFGLVLLSLLLHLRVWSLRRDGRARPADADPGPSFPRPPPPPGEESYSIQFPEEEHGDKSQEKLSILSLKVYSELR